MTLKIIPLFLYVLLGFSAYSQEYYVVADRETKAPVPFANIKSLEQIFYTNLHGQVEKKFLLKSNSLIVSCIGYHSKKFNSLNKRDTLFIEPYTVQIPTVDIKPSKSRKTIEVGYHKKRTFFPNHFIGKDSLILAVFIPNEYGNKQINKIVYALSQLKNSDKFMTLLFEVDENKQPGNAIYKEVINVQSLNRKGNVNISNEHIFFPENGLFVGFAWVSENKKYDVNLYEEVKVKVFDNKNTITSYLFRHNQWESIKPIVPRFGLTLFE